MKTAGLSTEALANVVTRSFIVSQNIRIVHINLELCGLPSVASAKDGPEGRIRTFEGKTQQIYSL
ncbi:MAG: hypothetical protein AAB437_04940, partial [Patescibacteria group bacterium]